MRAIAVLCALVLLHCLVTVPRAAAVERVGAGTASRDYRKLLRKVAARSAGTQLLDAAAGEARRADVGASLKKQAPSRSNPKQN
uniref:Secreted protein n=1 Tax=Arundo donax TaxID=35708 RepID=A0A0A9BBB1_ARUDO